MSNAFTVGQHAFDHDRPIMTPTEQEEQQHYQQQRQPTSHSIDILLTSTAPITPIEQQQQQQSTSHSIDILLTSTTPITPIEQQSTSTSIDISPSRSMCSINPLIIEQIKLHIKHFERQREYSKSRIWIAFPRCATKKRHMKRFLIKFSPPIIIKYPKLPPLDTTTIPVIPKSQINGPHLSDCSTLSPSQRSIISSLPENRPILLQGPPGSGKSLLLRHLASLFGHSNQSTTTTSSTISNTTPLLTNYNTNSRNDDYNERQQLTQTKFEKYFQFTDGIITVYIDDQLDSKMLLGSHTVTAIPGEFIFRYGPLSQAMLTGKWIIFENLQNASFELLSSLIPLFEHNKILLPGRHEILKAKQGFRVLGTWTTLPTSCFCEYINITGKEWYYDINNSSFHCSSDKNGINLTSVEYLQQQQLLPQEQSQHQQQENDITTATTPNTMNDDSDTDSDTDNESKSKQQPTPTPSTTNDNNNTNPNPSQLLIPIDPTTPNYGLVSQFFSTVRLTNPTLCDLYTLIAYKYPFLRSKVGLLKAAFKTVQLFGGFHTHIKSLQAPLVSPFGISCSITIRSILRYFAQLDALMTSLPSHLFTPMKQPGKINQIEQNIHLSSINTDINNTIDIEQLSMTPDLSFEFARISLECFTSASPPPQNEQVLEHRQLYIKHLCEIWDMQYNDFISKLDSRNPSLAPATRKKLKYSTKFTIGTLSLPRDAKASHTMLSNNYKFSTTRHARLNMEIIFKSIQTGVPILLVGETGTGKTALVQYLAKQLGQKLHIHNLHQQSESSDLLGGYKPIESIISQSLLTLLFDELLPHNDANSKLQLQVKTLQSTQKWQLLIELLSSIKQDTLDPNSNPSNTIHDKWTTFGTLLRQFESQVTNAQTNSFQSCFVEGPLIKALKEGHWILLDQFNLTPNEILHRLSSLLEDQHGSISLTERGDIEYIQRHPNFRLFACMNPSTDAGKKDLPLSIRNRFSEIYIHDILNELDLIDIVRDALDPSVLQVFNQNDIIPKIVNWYLQMKLLSKTDLFDGSQQHPHYSTRSLTRALRFTLEFKHIYGTTRALYEGLTLSFLSPLSSSSRLLADSLLWTYIFQYLRVKTPQLPTTTLPNHQAQTKHRELLIDFMNLYQRTSPVSTNFIGPHLIPRGPKQIDGDNDTKPKTITKLDDKDVIPLSKLKSFVITPSIDSRLNDISRGIVINMKFQPLTPMILFGNGYKLMNITQRNDNNGIITHNQNNNNNNSQDENSEQINFGNTQTKEITTTIPEQLFDELSQSFYATNATTVTTNEDNNNNPTTTNNTNDNIDIEPTNTLTNTTTVETGICDYNSSTFDYSDDEKDDCRDDVKENTFISKKTGKEDSEIINMNPRLNHPLPPPEPLPPYIPPSSPPPPLPQQQPHPQQQQQLQSKQPQQQSRQQLSPPEQSLQPGYIPPPSILLTPPKPKPIIKLRPRIDQSTNDPAPPRKRTVTKIKFIPPPPKEIEAPQQQVEASKARLEKLNQGPVQQQKNFDCDDNYDPFNPDAGENEGKVLNVDGNINDSYENDRTGDYLQRYQASVDDQMERSKNLFGGQKWCCHLPNYTGFSFQHIFSQLVKVQRIKLKCHTSYRFFTSLSIPVLFHIATYEISRICEVSGVTIKKIIYKWGSPPHEVEETIYIIDGVGYVYDIKSVNVYQFDTLFGGLLDIHLHQLAVYRSKLFMEGASNGYDFISVYRDDLSCATVEYLHGDDLLMCMQLAECLGRLPADYSFQDVFTLLSTVQYLLGGPVMQFNGNSIQWSSNPIDSTMSDLTCAIDPYKIIFDDFNINSLRFTPSNNMNDDNNDDDDINNDIYSNNNNNGNNNNSNNNNNGNNNNSNNNNGNNNLAINNHSNIRNNNLAINNHSNIRNNNVAIKPQQHLLSIGNEIEHQQQQQQSLPFIIPQSKQNNNGDHISNNKNNDNSNNIDVQPRKKRLLPAQSISHSYFDTISHQSNDDQLQKIEPLFADPINPGIEASSQTFPPPKVQFNLEGREKKTQRKELPHARNGLSSNPIPHIKIPTTRSIPDVVTSSSTHCVPALNNLLFTPTFVAFTQHKPGRLYWVFIIDGKMVQLSPQSPGISIPSQQHLLPISGGIQHHHQQQQQQQQYEPQSLQQHEPQSLQQHEPQSLQQQHFPLLPPLGQIDNVDFTQHVGSQEEIYKIGSTTSDDLNNYYNSIIMRDGVGNRHVSKAGASAFSWFANKREYFIHMVLLDPEANRNKFSSNSNEWHKRMDFKLFYGLALERWDVIQNYVMKIASTVTKDVSDFRFGFGGGNSAFKCFNPLFRYTILHIPFIRRINVLESIVKKYRLMQNVSNTYTGGETFTSEDECRSIVQTASEQLNVLRLIRYKDKGGGENAHLVLYDETFEYTCSDINAMKYIPPVEALIAQYNRILGGCTTRRKYNRLLECAQSRLIQLTYGFPSSTFQVRTMALKSICTLITKLDEMLNVDQHDDVRIHINELLTAARARLSHLNIRRKFVAGHDYSEKEIKWISSRYALEQLEENLERQINNGANANAITHFNGLLIATRARLQQILGRFNFDPQYNYSLSDIRWISNENVVVELIQNLEHKIKKNINDQMAVVVLNELLDTAKKRLVQMNAKRRFDPNYSYTMKDIPGIYDKLVLTALNNHLEDQIRSNVNCSTGNSSNNILGLNQLLLAVKVRLIHLNHHLSQHNCSNNDDLSDADSSASDDESSI